jgi:hypothetical protein
MAPSVRCLSPLFLLTHCLLDLKYLSTKYRAASFSILIVEKSRQLNDLFSVNIHFVQLSHNHGCVTRVHE